MFDPKYSITALLLANIKRIAELTAALNSRHFSKVVLYDFEKKARELSAHSSTSIEGNPLPLTEVKRLLRHTPDRIRDSEREVLNYNKALVYLEEKVRKDNSFNLDLILKTQAQVVDGLLDKFRTGKIRQEPVFVLDPRTGQPVFLPPDHQDVPELLNDLIKFLHENHSKLDPLIIAGIFHKQFVLIHPFIDGNGRTTRLMTKVLLAAMGLNTFNLFSFENYYNQNVTKYFQHVGENGNYYDIKDQIDFSSWLEYFTDGIIDELLRVTGELEKVLPTPDTKLQPHLQKILEYITEKGFITDREYATFTKRAKPTRNLDFRKLIDLGLIEMQGKAQKTYYILKKK